MKFKLSCASVAAIIAGSVAPTYAQNAPTSEEGGVSDQIFITATKREQTLQEVPIAVSVVDAEVVERAQIVDAFDLQSVVPTLRISQLERSANTTFIIRGFGNGGNNIGIEPSVGVFIDGVFRTRSSGSISDFPDIERVEVLRGPQSTLFGKNASAGVVSFVTAAPSFEWSGKLEGTYGNYDQVIGKAYVTGPLSESVAFSLGGSINKRDGYVTNRIDGSDLNDRDRWMVRGQLLVEPTDTLSVRLIGDYDRIEETCCYAPNFFNGPTGGAIVALGGVVPDDPFSYDVFLNFNPENEVENFGFSGQVDWEVGDVTVTSITSYREQDVSSLADVDFTSADLIRNANNWGINTFTQELRVAGGTERFDWLLGGFYYNEDLEASGFATFDSQFAPYVGILSDGVVGTVESILGAGTFFEPGTGSFESFTQDNDSFNFFGQVDWYATDRLTLTGGVGYVNDRKTVTGSAVNTDLFSSLDLVGIFSNPAVVTPDVLRALDLPTLSGGAIPGQFDDVVFATLFGQVVMQEPTPANIGAWQALLLMGDPVAGAQFGAITAATPSTEPLVAAQIQAGLVPLVDAQLGPLQFLPPFLAFPNAVESGRTKDDKVTYTLRAAYDVTNEVNAYASYTTGFKASSWNLTRDSSYFAADEAALAGEGLVPTNRDAGTRFASPEDVKVYEIGAKAQLDRATLNIALFHQTIEGFQSTTFQGTAFVLANAGEQRAKGIEVDLTVNPTDSLTLGFAGLFIDPEYVDFQNAPGVGGPTDLSGETPAGIHTVSLSFGAQYEAELTNTLTGFIRADYQHENEVQVIDNIPEDILSREVNLLNGSIGIVSENGYEATIWARNITQDKYSQSGFPTAAQDGSFNGYPNTPRTFGITVRKRW